MSSNHWTQCIKSNDREDTRHGVLAPLLLRRALNPSNERLVDVRILTVISKKLADSTLIKFPAIIFHS